MDQRVHRIVIPKERLPDDAQARRNYVRRYFSEHQIEIDESRSDVILLLRWPEIASRYVDPNLEYGLRWWSKCFGVETSVSEIPRASVREKNLRLSLHDSWSLHSWSQWASSINDLSELYSTIALLHVDDHNDLMTPRIVRTGENLHDLITGDPFCIRDPFSISSAIESGAVGIGSFIVPLLHQVNTLHVRHLRAFDYSPGCRRGAFTWSAEQPLTTCSLRAPSGLPWPSRRSGTRTSCVAGGPNISYPSTLRNGSALTTNRVTCYISISIISTIVIIWTRSGTAETSGMTLRSIVFWEVSTISSA